MEKFKHELLEGFKAEIETCCEYMGMCRLALEDGQVEAAHHIFHIANEEDDHARTFKKLCHHYGVTIPDEDCRKFESTEEELKALFRRLTS